MKLSKAKMKSLPTLISMLKIESNQTAERRERLLSVYNISERELEFFVNNCQ